MNNEELNYRKDTTARRTGDLHASRGFLLDRCSARQGPLLSVLLLHRYQCSVQATRGHWCMSGGVITQSTGHVRTTTSEVILGCFFFRAQRAAVKVGKGKAFLQERISMKRELKHVLSEVELSLRRLLG